MKLPNSGAISYKYLTNDIVAVTCRSMIDNSETVVNITADQHQRLMKWMRGEGLIQNMLPELDTNKREMLMTGINNEQWEEITRGYENEDFHCGEDEQAF